MAVKKKGQPDQSLFPSWKSYVEILAQTLTDEGKPKEAILVQALVESGKPKYLEAMQHAYDELGKPIWYQKLNENFKKDEIDADPDSLELPKLIWQLGTNVVFTTNIDRVLEWKSVKEGPIEILDAQNVEFSELQGDNNPPPSVVYLHGRIGDKENIVFTREQYDRFYNSHENEAKLRTLQAFLTTKSFLFMGFSLDDAYFVEELKNIHNIYKGGIRQYYVLIKEKDAGKLKDFEFVTEVYYEDIGEPLRKVVREMRDLGDKVIITKSIPILPPAKDERTEPFFNVPYNSKGSEFVGRTGKTEEIWNLLNQEGCASIGQAVSVKGLGGLGKTQLAVEYAHKFHDKYKNGVFWLVADEGIDNQLLQIADSLGWINHLDKSVDQLGAAKRKFLELSESLIIFDNVEAYGNVRDYLPKTNLKTHILITSREKIAEFRPINLELLDRDESRELLLQISNRQLMGEIDTECSENILEMLADIPLAVELVGGYLAEHENVTFAKYLQFLNEVPFDKLEKEFPKASFTNHDRSIIRTLRISEKLIKDKPLMVEMLNVLAWSGSSSMGTSLLRSLVAPEDEFEFETALGDALNLRVLKKDGDSNRYAIHRLLAKVIRYQNPIEKNIAWYQNTTRRMENWFELRKNEYDLLAEFEGEFEHLKEWRKEALNKLPSEAILLTSLQANPLWLRGNYKKALAYQFEALDLYQKEKIKNPKLLAILFITIGYLNYELKNFVGASEYCEKALEFFDRKEVTDNKLLADLLNDAGLSYRELGKYQQALKYLQQALEIRQELFSSKHPEIAKSLNNLGSAYEGLGEKEKTLKLRGQALEMRKELFGENHPDVSVSLHCIGFTYYKFKDLRSSGEYFQAALKMRREFLGESHPETIASAIGFIDTLVGLGKIEQAGRLAAEFLSHVLPTHPERWFLEKHGSAYRKAKQRRKKRR